MQTQTTLQNKKGISASMKLILLCWLIYAFSYVGKVNYAASINQVMSNFGVAKAEAGLVSSFFFFAYGIGQILNGIFCKKYNLKLMISGSLLVSAVANVTVALLPLNAFGVVKVVWLINGISMSILWPSLIRLITETLPKSLMVKSTLIMGTTVAVGTCVAYGTSAIIAVFSPKHNFIFFVAAAVLVTIAIIWMIAVTPLTKAAKKEEEAEEKAEAAAEAEIPTETRRNAPAKNIIMLTICMLALYGVATNLIKDGLTSWMPTILKEQYLLPDYISILLTLALPIVSIFSNFLTVYLHKHIPDYIFQNVFVFGSSGLLVVGIIAGLGLNNSIASLIITLLGFTLVTFIVYSSNTLITSLFPMEMKGKINSGLIAGVLNGFCYVGSTLSTYGLGAIADAFTDKEAKYYGWNEVFWTIFGICMVVSAAAIVYTCIRRAMTVKNKSKESIAEKAEENIEA